MSRNVLRGNETCYSNVRINIISPACLVGSAVVCVHYCLGVFCVKKLLFIYLLSHRDVMRFPHPPQVVIV